MFYLYGFVDLTDLVFRTKYKVYLSKCIEDYKKNWLLTLS